MVVNNEMEMKWLWCKLENHSKILHLWLGKTMKNQSQNSHCPSWDTILIFAEYKSQELPLEPTCSCFSVIYMLVALKNSRHHWCSHLHTFQAFIYPSDHISFSNSKINSSGFDVYLVTVLSRRRGFLPLQLTFFEQMWNSNIQRTCNTRIQSRNKNIQVIFCKLTIKRLAYLEFVKSEQ
jgi:hypothetical protein